MAVGVWKSNTGDGLGRKIDSEDGNLPLDTAV